MNKPEPAVMASPQYGASRTKPRTIPTVPFWMQYVRYGQIVNALLVLILCAYPIGALSGYFGLLFGSGPLGYGIFCAIATLIYLITAMLIAIYSPVYYFKWGVLAAECLAVLFWLSAMGSLASLASVAGWVDGTTLTNHGPWGAIAAAAFFAAMEWISFIVTLVFYSIGCHQYRLQKFQGRGGPGYMGPGAMEAGQVPLANTHQMNTMNQQGY